MSRHGGRAIVHNDERQSRSVIHGVYESGNACMNEGRIADNAHDLLIRGCAESAAHTNACAHAEGGIDCALTHA